MPPAGFEFALPATNLPQAYAVCLVATGISDCGVTCLKETDFDSEMNIAIEQRKAMCECTLLECNYRTYVV